MKCLKCNGDNVVFKVHFWHCENCEFDWQSLDDKDKQIAELQEKLAIQNVTIKEQGKYLCQSTEKLHRRNLQIADLKKVIKDLEVHGKFKLV